MKHIKDFSTFLLETKNLVNFDKAVSDIANMDDWSYEELEGDDCYRFDKGEGDDGESLWIYKSGSAEGSMTPEIKEYLKKAGFSVAEDEE